MQAFRERRSVRSARAFQRPFRHRSWTAGIFGLLLIGLSGCAAYQDGTTPLHSNNPFGPGFNPMRGYPEIADPRFSTYYWR